MRKRFKIAICEDEINDVRLLTDIIKNCGILCDFVIFDSAEGLLAYNEISGFDLFLLDIYLSGMDGIRLAREIRTKNEDCEIVFTTVSDAHALDGFEVNALQYILKPLDTQKVSDMLKRLIRISDRRDLGYCTVVVDRTDVNVYHRDIYYIEAFDKYCRIHTENGIIETYSSLAGLLNKLPQPPFLRCHRGYVVNMEHVQGVTGDFIMKTGDVVYIRRSEREKIKKEYMRYLAENARGEINEKIFG